MININEGGNVFKGPQGEPLTQRINQSDVASTVKWLESLTGLDFSRNKDENGVPVKWLGSTGRKPTSGDLDLAVDSNEINKDQLVAILNRWAQDHGQDPKNWIKKTGEAVHFKTPIGGRSSRGFVQTDFMFMPNLTWGIFYLSSAPDSEYKGIFRNVLMSSIAKLMGLKVSNKGVIDRGTEKIITLDPDQAAKMLLGKTSTVENLSSVENIYRALAKDPQRDVKLADFRNYLAQSELSEPGTIKESETDFLSRLRDRIINQGMTPLIETQYRPLTEAKDPRIPHLEDLVFQKGMTGVNEVLSVLQDAAKNTVEVVTIKWDGSPAVYFGRKDNGQFVLTDKPGLTAVGYDGQATSPEMITQIMQQRDAAAAAKGKAATRVDELVPMYRDIWPYFEAAVPENFRGYVKGDMLYWPTQLYVENAGNYEFQPNKVFYRIPVVSTLGQQIAGTLVGIVIHNYIKEPLDPETPISSDFVEKNLKAVPGLMMTLPTVKNLQPLTMDTREINRLRKDYSSYIQTLLNPANLRSQDLSNFADLAVTFINSLVGTDFENANGVEFLEWLNKVNPRTNKINAGSTQKLNNIIEYIDAPQIRLGLEGAFDMWQALHNLKKEIMLQLDRQVPGQEGWVFSSPSGRFKAVSRTAGGFTAMNRAQNNPTES